MSFNTVVTKLLQSMKEELQKEENIQTMREDIIKPVVEQIFMIMYPYFIGMGCVFIMIIVIIFVILFLNIKICYQK
tara:strand:+ start:461 stop:688 length:228 start_codon:yes stop_codon:yes gene_type:complete